MNKTELAAAVAAQTGMTEKDAEQVIACTFDTIAAALAKGEKVQLVGFGAFETKDRAAHIGRNPSTGEAMEIPAGRTPVFKAGKNLKERVAK